MKKILVFFGGGGHTEQALRFVQKIGNRYEYECVFVKGDKLSEARFDLLVNELNLIVIGKFYINKIRETKENKLYNFLYLLYGPILNVWESIMLGFKIKSRTLISFGPGLCIPLCYISKLRGCKIIFLESWSRVWTPSLTGKLIYPISNHFFVQWPELLRKYPKAKYLGRLG